MKTLLVPACANLFEIPYFYLSRFPRCTRDTLDVGAAKDLGTLACRVNVDALLLILEPGEIDEAGMYVWAGILAVVGVLASYGIALAWQRWRAGQKT